MNQELTINPKFQQYFASLDEAESQILEASLINEGMREPIKVWNGTIVDGHNRYSIAQKHGLEYKVEEIEFEDEEEAQMWMITNQLGRRNIAPHLRTMYLGELHLLIQKRQGAQVGNTNAAKNKPDTVSDSFSTAEQIAHQFNVSPRTVERGTQLAKAYRAAEEDVQQAFRKGDITAKEIIKPPEPRKPTKQAASKWYDEFTETVRAQAERIELAINKAVSLTDDLQAVFAAQNQHLRHFAPSLVTIHGKLEGIDEEVRKLKTLIRCPIPEESDMACAECYDTGYITEAQAEGLQEYYDKAA